MKSKLIFLFLVLLSISVFAVVDRVIDPEIPISDDFIDFETEFDDILFSGFTVVILGIGTMAGTVILAFGIGWVASLFK